MKIPAGHYERESLYQQLILDAFSSRPARIAMYDTLKNYFMWGTAQETQPVEYNKLAAHLDLLTSFLFSGETTSFVVEDDDDGEGEPDFELSKASKVSPSITKYWNRTNMDIIFNEALLWALVYQTMFIKMVPSESGLFSPYVVDPHSIGVLLEHEPMMDRQPCIVHEFFITKSDLARRVKKLPDADQKMILAMCGPTQAMATGTATPQTGTDRLIIAATSPNIQGNVVNPTSVVYDFNAQINEDCCLAQELWIWDDDKADYRVATMLESEYLLFDDGNNPFVPKEQAFVKICPNSIYNYFWGMSEMIRLIPIQEWVNERIPEIKKHLQKQTNPPRSASGFGGFADEKAYSVLDNPGGTVYEPSPTGAKIDQHLPAAIDVFSVLDRAEMMFAEVSGIRELMQGKGESGVRAKSHADLLVRVGSSRVKKKAAILEDAVEKIGHLIFLLMKKYDKRHYKTDKDTSFMAAQITGAIVKVDSHSSSPIFIEQQIDKAQIAFKAGAIDREDLIDALKLQNPAYLKRKLKVREKMEAEAKAKETATESEKDKPKEEGK